MAEWLASRAEGGLDGREGSETPPRLDDGHTDEGFPILSPGKYKPPVAQQWGPRVVWIAGTCLGGTVGYDSVIMPGGGLAGAGLLPFMCACLLTLACLAELFRGLSTRRSHSDQTASDHAAADGWVAYVRLGGLLVALFAYALLMSYVGFLADTFALGIVFGVTTGTHRRTRAAVILSSWLLCVVVWLLFSRVFSLVLPSGSLG